MLVTSSLFPRDYSGYVLDCSMRGIKNARGEYVVRIDAHSYVEKDFLLKNVETLLEMEKYGVACVGGTLTTSSLTNKGKVIATILSSPFGVGNSRFRYSNKRE